MPIILTHTRDVIMPFTLTREQLYDLVWSEPLQRLGKQIGISDVGLAKQCRNIGVPLPIIGPWLRF
jgi:tetrahydromethanopterin S-methyltransferase subunit G